MSIRGGWLLWIRWTLANALAEVVGLGATFAIGVGLFAGLSEAPGIVPAIVSALIMTSSGIIEGAAVGVAQWWAMRPAFVEIRRRAWVCATVIGAWLAWLLGSLPMTIARLSMQDQDGLVQQSDALVMLLMAFALGMVAGVVLGLPQWRILRRTVERAWWWLPANGVAWAVGMPIVFVGVDLAQERGTIVSAIITMAVTLAVTGTAVGAIHGVALVQLWQNRDAAV